MLRGRVRVRESEKMEGYLEKQKKKGKSRSRWVKRYFKTIGNHLCYSEKKEPYKVIGSIPLDETRFSRPDPREPLTITMSVTDGRMYDLRAENEHDAAAWRSFFASFVPLAGLAMTPSPAAPPARPGSGPMPGTQAPWSPPVPKNALTASGSKWGNTTLPLPPPQANASMLMFPILI